MATLIGILVDGSGSMHQYVDGGFGVEDENWSRSIIKVVDELIQHDVSSESKVFAICYGAVENPAVFDLINTVDRSQKRSSTLSTSDKYTMVNKIMNILEQNGAPNIRKWTDDYRLCKNVSKEEAQLFLAELSDNSDFRESFILNCLPERCRGYNFESLVVGVGNYVGYVVPPVENTFEAATNKGLRATIRKGKELLWQYVVARFGPDTIMSVKEAYSIFHEFADDRSLTNKEIDRLKKYVDPFMFGSTPMISALKTSKQFLAIPGDFTKMLFVLSDGSPTDGMCPPTFTDSNVYVISCYVSENENIDPKRFYNTAESDWDETAKFMFKLSSSFPTEDLPQTIFAQRDWKIDFENNEAKLFVQINHPKFIKEVCQFAKDIVSSQDCLSNTLAYVALDEYINPQKHAYIASEQDDNACYAAASATVLHLAMKRIIHREGGYPDFSDLHEEILQRFSKPNRPGGHTFEIVRTIVTDYRLRCQEIDAIDAMKAVASRRPVLARFRLYENQWSQFNNFFSRNRRGILSKKDLDGHPIGKKLGHAVVLTSFDSQCFRFMNSWGTEWGDEGFFRIKDSHVMFIEFMDVFWEKCYEYTDSALKPSEKESMQREGPKRAGQLFHSLKSLQKATYTCPLGRCQQTSLVSTFHGRLAQVTCPKCRGQFDAQNNEDAHDLVLNLYLTSLQRYTEV